MKFELKNYKLKKAINYYKKTPIFFIFNVSNVDSKNWLKTEQNFYKHDLKYSKVYNTLLTKVVKKSIFQKIDLIVNNFTCFVYFENNPKELTFQKLITLSPFMSFLGLKLNHKIYSLPQLQNVSTLDYKKNVNTLNKLMKKMIKLPYSRLNK